MGILIEQSSTSDGSRTQTSDPKILCKLNYVVCRLNEINKNNRMYSAGVWERVREDQELQQKIKDRTLFGSCEHPNDLGLRLDKDVVSHVVTGISLGEGVVTAELELLPTQAGYFINTLLEAGCKVGVSTRAKGDLKEVKKENSSYFEVIPESYKLSTIDFTADPSTLKTEPEIVQKTLIRKVQEEYKASHLNREAAQLLLESTSVSEKDKVLGEVSAVLGPQLPLSEQKVSPARNPSLEGKSSLKEEVDSTPVGEAPSNSVEVSPAPSPQVAKSDEPKVQATLEKSLASIRAGVDDFLINKAISRAEKETKGGDVNFKRVGVSSVARTFSRFLRGEDWLREYYLNKIKILKGQHCEKLSTVESQHRRYLRSLKRDLRERNLMSWKALESEKKKVLEQYIESRLSSFGSFNKDKVRALLEQCSTKEQVDIVVEEYREALREGRLHSDSPSEIEVSPVVHDKGDVNVKNMIVKILGGM